MSSKVCSIEEAADLISNGMVIALSGEVLHRIPMDFVRELIRQGKRQLTVVKTVSGLDVDMLAGSGCLSNAIFGAVTLEPAYGLARNFRRAVEKCRVNAIEHTCYTVIMSLRAAAYGIPFIPIGRINSDITKIIDVREVIDPYSREKVQVVRALKPEYAIIHAHIADNRGNAVIEGIPPYYEKLISEASSNVIITTEKLVDKIGDQFKVTIPYFRVNVVVKSPFGAHPASMHPLYQVDEEHLKLYIEHSRSDESFNEYLRKYVFCGRLEYYKRVGLLEKLIC